MENNTTENYTQATTESFWSLIEKVKFICIPRIQRDYAQGRLDFQATQVREAFVDDLFNSVVNYKPLDVNFIYGNVEDGRFIPIDGQQRLTTLFLFHWYFAVFCKKIDKPEVEKQIDNPVKKRLLRFRYETRVVTGEFCQKLVDSVWFDFSQLRESEKYLDSEDKKKKQLSNIIKNYYWFFSDYDSDSSIRAMLVMIDAIHNKAKEYCDKGISLDNVFNDLISKNASIKFSYLDICDKELTESIYIKMNARGKALTSFENFKAQLGKYLEKRDKSFTGEFIDSVNGEWSQFFWTPDYRKLIEDKSEGTSVCESSFDSQMIKFFRFCMYTDYITRVRDEKINRDIVRDALKKIDETETDYVFVSRLFKDGFRNVYNIKSDNEVLCLDTFKNISKLLNVLAKRQRDTNSIKFTDGKGDWKSYLDEKKSFLRLIGTDNSGLSLEEQIVLYAEYAFLIKYANTDYSFDKEMELTRWLRLVSNLVSPTLNIQTNVFFSMIRSVNKLVMSENNHALNSDEYMCSLVFGTYQRDHDMSPFTTTQVEEESIKSLLMKDNDGWKNAIIDSENTFMGGQTGALFDFSGLTAEYERQISEFKKQSENQDVKFLPPGSKILSGIDCESEYYRKFDEYLKKFKLLFDNNGVRRELEDDALFIRALLCYGGEDSYMLDQCFLDNNSQSCSFKRLLRDKNKSNKSKDQNDPGKRSFLKELMDEIKLDGGDVADQLQAIIDKNIQKGFEGSRRWKKYFVEMPEILNSIKPKGKLDPDGCWVFERPQRFIRKNSDDDILLLSKTSTSSYNRELYSYVFFLKARKCGLDGIKYRSAQYEESEKYAYYDNPRDERIQIVYKKNHDDLYRYVVRKEADGTEITSFSLLEDTLNYVKSDLNNTM